MTDPIKPEEQEEGATEEASLSRSVLLEAIKKGPSEEGQQQATDEEMQEQEAEEGEQQGEAEEIPEDLLAELEGLTASLRSLGLETPIPAEHYQQLPPELRETFRQAVTKVVEQVSDYLSGREKLEESLAQIEFFQRNLESQPDKVLLGVALSAPETFKKVAELVGEMENDPRLRESILRELQAEARMAEAERRERAILAKDVTLRAKMVTAATKAAAAKYGVDYNVAEEFVAKEIALRKGNFGPSDVEPLVARLAPKKTKPPVTSSKKIQAQKTAPTARASSTAAAAAAAATRTEAEKGPEGGGLFGIFRGLIRSALERT